MTVQAAHKWNLQPGTPELLSAGQLTFGPDGILIVGDSRGAALWAIDTGDVQPAPLPPTLKIADLSAKLLPLFPDAKSVTVNDLAVNPLSGQVYLSLSVGEAGAPGLARIDATGQPKLLSLTNVPCLKATLPNPPEDKVTGTGPRARNRRNEAVTDLAFIEGKVLVAGMTNDQAPSKVLEIPFPFAAAEPGTTVEIYHAAHNRVEDGAAIRTFVPLTIGGEPMILAGFTCTPLVRLPIKGLEPGSKVRGTTVAELGNWNTPLDLIAYEKDGKQHLLMANTARGVMKISMEGIDRENGLTEHVKDGGTAGQSFEKLPALEGTVQLDKLSPDSAVVIRKDGEALNLEIVPLP